jgi:hypothetical protein
MPMACLNIRKNLKLISSSTTSTSCLISEMHFTEKSHLKLPNYTTYHTNHPAGTARGGTSIIIKNCNKHHQLNSYSQDILPATSVSVEDSVGCLSSSKAHSEARTIRRFYNTKGRRFIAVGEFNAKHTEWGSRHLSCKGGEVHKTMKSDNLKHLSTGEPTYWT